MVFAAESEKTHTSHVLLGWNLARGCASASREPYFWLSVCGNLNFLSSGVSSRSKVADLLAGLYVPSVMEGAQLAPKTRTRSCEPKAVSVDGELRLFVIWKESTLPLAGGGPAAGKACS